MLLQAVNTSDPMVIKAQSALLRDRWCYFVRTAALEQHLASGCSSAAGSEVVGAAEQVADAAAELMQLMQQLVDSVQLVIDSQQKIASLERLQEGLTAAEAGDELQELLAWCLLQGPMDVRPADADSSGKPADSSSSSSSKVSAGAATLLEQAWRVSFAPYAARGLANALASTSSSSSSSCLSSPAEDASEALEMTDLGLRLEAAVETAQALRSSLAAQLALAQL